MLTTAGSSAGTRLSWWRYTLQIRTISNPTMRMIPTRAVTRRAMTASAATAVPYNPPPMRAILIREHGGTEKLERTEVPDPVAGPGEALIEVRAVALNHLDLWVRRGVPGHKFHLPMIPGAEVAGLIESVAENDRWKKGDEVIVAPGFSCGLCPACLSGNDPLCVNFGIFGENRNGGCAEK